jgi:hypothetical protein
MKASRFRETINELHKRLIDLTVTKGEEYKRREDSQFANFDRCAAELGLTREQVLMVYLNKHLNSIVVYTKDSAAGGNKAYAEPIVGRIDDSILYLLILRGMVEDRELAATAALSATLEPDPVSSSGPDTAVIQEHGQKDRYIAIEPCVFVSRDLQDAKNWCERVGVPSGTSALSTPDQLHGVKPPTKVYFIHHGNASDDALRSEIQERCDKQSLILGIVAP